MARKRFIVTLVCDVRRDEEADEIQFDLEDLFATESTRNFEIEMIEEETYNYDDDDDDC